MSDALEKGMNLLEKAMKDQRIIFHTDNKIKAASACRWENRLGIAMIRELQQRITRGERLLIDCKGRDYATTPHTPNTRSQEASNGISGSRE